MVARPVGGEDLALDAAMPEAARDEDAGRAREPLADVVRRSAASLSTQRTRASTPFAQAACLRASVTER